MTLIGEPVQSESAGQFDFGQALYHLKKGRMVQRTGWNGKGMHLWLNKGNVAADNQTISVSIGDTMQVKSKLIEGVDPGLFDVGGEGTVTRLPNINMRSASGATVTGWLASQTDMLSSDWQIVE